MKKKKKHKKKCEKMKIFIQCITLSDLTRFTDTKILPDLLAIFRLYLYAKPPINEPALTTRLLDIRVVSVSVSKFI